MEMIIADNTIQKEYVKWMVRKELCTKQAYTLWFEYLHVFGDLLKENYRWKCACKYLQKCMQYSNGSRDRKEIEQRVQEEMASELEEWMELCQQVEKSKYLAFVSDGELQETQKIFQKIQSKLLTSNDPLYMEARDAYFENDLDILNQINNKVKISNNKNYMFMQEQTKHLQKEVDQIQNEQIVPYARLLDSVISIQKTYKEIKEDTKVYKYYYKLLTKNYKKRVEYVDFPLFSLQTVYGLEIIYKIGVKSYEKII